MNIESVEQLSIFDDEINEPLEHEVVVPFSVPKIVSDVEAPYAETAEVGQPPSSPKE